MADRAGETMPERKAIQEFLDGLAEEFARLRTDAPKWKEDLLEREAWDATLEDDLDEER